MGNIIIIPLSQMRKPKFREVIHLLKAKHIKYSNIYFFFS